MGILARFSDIIKANINELLDKCEDPEKMIDQYLRNAMDDLAEVKKETAAVMAEEKRCKRLYDEKSGEVAKYAELAKKALTAGNEGDATVFIGKKQECEAELAGIEKTYSIAKANADKMRQMHDKLSADIQNLQSRRENIKATMAVARTQDKMNKAQDAMGSARGSVAAFDRMENKAQAMLDQANAMADLSAEPVDEADKLADKYGASGSASVADELARMKAEMGL